MISCFRTNKKLFCFHALFLIAFCDSDMYLTTSFRHCQELFFNLLYLVSRPSNKLKFSGINHNGERGIWTLAPRERPTPLAGAPLQPLEYFSIQRFSAEQYLVYQFYDYLSITFFIFFIFYLPFLSLYNILLYNMITIYVTHTYYSFYYLLQLLPADFLLRVFL